MSSNRLLTDFRSQNPAIEHLIFNPKPNNVLVKDLSYLPYTLKAYSDNGLIYCGDTGYVYHFARNRDIDYNSIHMRSVYDWDIYYPLRRITADSILQVEFENFLIGNNPCFLRYYVQDGQIRYDIILGDACECNEYSYNEVIKLAESGESSCAVFKKLYKEFYMIKQWANQNKT